MNLLKVRILNGQQQLVRLLGVSGFTLSKYCNIGYDAAINQAIADLLNRYMIC